VPYFSVRIEVMRAIGTKISNGQRNAYCVATQAKPYLSVGPTSGPSGGGMFKGSFDFDIERYI